MTHKEQFEELITIISKSCKRHNIALSECERDLIAMDILGDRKCAKNAVACGEHDSMDTTKETFERREQ